VDVGPGPSLVAGDFDMPSESAIYRRHWGSMHNGFSRAGVGFGYSRRAGWIHLRIDHVLADDDWVVQSAQLLPDYGSDHLPMMVDVALRTK
jgi:endonuclease/exonuclease/phosphatase (EEP) superfamily protein YafD